MKSRSGFLHIALAYCTATIVAIGVYMASIGSDLIRILYADIAATCVIFVFSVWYRNSSFYDAYWSVAPIMIAGSLFVLGQSGNLTRELLVLILVSMWGVRLTWNWAYGWSGLDHEDWRYGMLQEKTGVFYWPVSFAGIHMFPTILVFLGCLPLFPVFTTNNPLNGWDLIAALMTLGAIALEAEADRELHQFRETRSSVKEILDQGVWSWCRHPNYLGELGFWLGLYLFGVAAYEGVVTWRSGIYMAVGPISMLLLFIVVSIPMIDKQMVATKPDYEAFKRRSFALLPLSFLRAFLRDKR